MSYARVDGATVLEYPVHEGDIRLRYPSTSFPRPFVPPQDYVLVASTPQPACNWDEDVIAGDPALIDGSWQQTWQVVPADAAELEQRTQAQADAVRMQRQQLLAGSDWTQIPDAGVNRSAWAAYRQALRQLPEQEGFPWSVAWPVPPEGESPAPDYGLFYDGLLMSGAYQAIRAQALSSLPLTVACTEFVAAIGDAKLGVANTAALQAAIGNVITAASLSPEQRQEIEKLLSDASLDGIYSLPIVA